MQIRTLIVDDEPLARARLSRLLENIDEVEIVSYARDGQEAVDISLSVEPDLILMDIQMPLKTGIVASKEILQKSKKIPAIIFCTAYDQFAIEAFKLNAVAYLLKPISPEDLEQAIKQTTKLTQLQIDTVMNESNAQTNVSIKTDAFFEKLQLEKILYFRSEGKSVVAGILESPEIVINYTLKELEQRYRYRIVRIHRNTLVMRDKIKRLVYKEKGSALVIIHGVENAFPVSRRSLSEVKKCFQ